MAFKSGIRVLSTVLRKTEGRAKFELYRQSGNFVNAAQAKSFAFNDSHALGYDKLLQIETATKSMGTNGL